MATLNHPPYTAEYVWRGNTGSPSHWTRARAVRGEMLLSFVADDGYTVELYDTGRLYTLRVYYWRGDRDISKEGYTHDSRYCGRDWPTLVSRAIARDVMWACIREVESAADEAEVELRH